MDKKIKLYGIFSFTKKHYIYAQCAVTVGLVGFWIWAIWGDLNELIFGYGTLLLTIVTIGESVETFVTLKKFNED